MPPHRFVRVAVAAPVGVLTYEVPRRMLEAAPGGLEPGHAVLVPLGRQRVMGWVVDTIEEPDVAADRLKQVLHLVDPIPALGPGQLSFHKWASRYYLAGLGEMLSTAMPSGARAQVRRVFVPDPSGAEALAAESLSPGRSMVLREVILRPGRTARGIERSLRQEMEGAAVRRALSRLEKDGMVRCEEKKLGAGRDRVVDVRLLQRPGEVQAQLPRSGPRMRSVVARLEEAGGAMELVALLDAEGGSAREAVRRLQAAGAVAFEERERLDPLDTGELGGASMEPLSPTGEQRAALDAVFSSAPRAWLLHGVTGSGKTEVYLQAAARVMANGRQVLMLVPEIGLTPQLVGRIRARFGDDVAVMHSGLTGRERLRAWRRVRADEAKVAVGARSALFAPFRDLGLVVVDEEHDDSYKQDEGVRYHARDLAVVLGRFSNCPVILGSATPATESLQNAVDGRYGLLRLGERVGGRPLAPVEIVDMTREPRRQDGDLPLLSGRLREALHHVLDSGGKAILFHGRRGYATVVQCVDCGGRYTCPSCGISLVLHRAVGKLLCHYCGLERRYQDSCEQCGGTLEALGAGAERLDQVLREMFPGVAMARMDADTTRTRGAHHRILEAFRTGECRVLVGTQVVAKGHDFPDVELAAAVGTDTMLTLPDFRSAERTWALMTQLAGRAGRGDRPGKVIIQTGHPDHFVFRHLDDPQGFHERESRQRRILAYPPFTRLVLVRLEGASRDATADAARAMARRLREARPPGRVVDVLGPAPAPLARLVGRWRYQVVLRGHDIGAFRTWLETQARQMSQPLRSGVRVVVDVDPRFLL